MSQQKCACFQHLNLFITDFNENKSVAPRHPVTVIHIWKHFTHKKNRKDLKEQSQMANSILPNEIWCQIFLYLDEKSLRTIASICKLFFELVRGNEKLSGCIILKSVMLKDLAIKIKNSEWIWDRWPSLKTLKIPIVHSEYSDSVYEKEAHRLIQEMKFETCSNLCPKLLSLELDSVGSMFEINFQTE